MFPRLVACALLLLTRSLPAEPLTSLAQIRALTPETAEKKLPVKIEVTVSLYDPEIGSFFVSDGQTGIYIKTEDRPVPAPRTGDRVRIEGFTQAGDYLPHIWLQRLERLGAGPPPIPRPVSGADLQEPGPDCEWVEFDALIKTTLVDRFGGLYFDLLVDGWRFKAYVSRMEKFVTPPWDLVERTVHVQCAVGTRFNNERQMCGRLLIIPGLSFLTPLDAAPSTEPIPLRRSSDLLRVTSPRREKARLRGVVTYLRPGSGFNLRDAGGSIRVQTGQPLAFSVGDVVETLGYAEAAEFRPLFNATEARRLQQGTPPPPVPLDPGAPLHSSQQQELVSLDARLIEVLRAPDQITLFFAAPGSTRFEASYSGELLAGLEPGSKLRLTGICTLFRNIPDERGYLPQRFQLRLRTPEDLSILEQPSLWTPRRLGWLAGGIGSLACSAALWAFLLKKQVRAQAAVIREQARHTATLDERQRIARELHDTLEQDLMGVTMLLEDAAERINIAAPEAVGALTIARRLLRRSREESRSTIRDLRSVALEQLGLPAAIEETLQPIATAARLRFEFVQQGLSRKLPVLVESSLLRIAHEALSNAARHAGAGHVSARLEYSNKEVRLEVSDDGRGFSPDEVDARAGHFGLQGIRERTNKIGGILQISSEPGHGTRLSVTVPATASKL